MLVATAVNGDSTMKYAGAMLAVLMVAVLMTATVAAAAPAPAPYGPEPAKAPPVKTSAPAKAPAESPTASPPPAVLARPAGEPPAAPSAPPAAPGAATGVSPETRVPVGVEDLKSLLKEAPLVVVFQAETVQAKTDVNARMPWEIRGPIIEVLKGNLLPGQISVHVDSVVRIFGLSRGDLQGKQFVAAVKPLAEAMDRRFQIVGPRAFDIDGSEAQALRRLALGAAEEGSGGRTLDLEVRPIDKVFAAAGSKTIEVRLTNKDTASTTYLQTPISEKDGKLYLTGQGSLSIRDTTGRTLESKGNIVTGQMPPPPPKPALILPGATFVENLDLAKYYALSEGRYVLTLSLATPDGRGRLSGGFSFQVGGTAETPATAKVEPIRLPGEPVPPLAPPAPALPKPPAAKSPETARPPVEWQPPAAPAERAAPAAPAIQVPDPARYQPGKSTLGLAGLLRPAKAKFILGEPVDLEFRLINLGPRTVAVDARLERTLTIQVQAVADSPQPLTVRQVIPWPADGAGLPEERAYLREGAFWGRTINLNTLYGKSLDEMPAPTAEEVAAGKGFTYERFGKNLFGFQKPGYYNVIATYVVSRTKPAEGQPPAEQPKEWWIGDLQTNPILIQITEPGR